MGKVANGEWKCNRTYHRVKREVLGEATPDGRRKRDLNCVVCNRIVHNWLTSKLKKGIEPHCTVCAEEYANGVRFKAPRSEESFPLQDWKRVKEKRRNRETVEIARIVKESNNVSS